LLEFLRGTDSLHELCTLKLNAVAFKGGSFPTPYTMSLGGGIIVSSLLNSKIDRDCFKIMRDFILNPVNVYMLQNAHSVRVRGIVILAVKVALYVGFVKLGQILLENSHLYQLLHEV
jgi:hypothetical protein